ncbi:unnamed protein product [Ambrosiozyma monospora]|uniref:Unnamed protein product n=1 Tax=Ambrosiozyma monospora TaxID=43982 RepID=A0A9W7DME9_AMBMO|nr:unnamed protein product [Ambrosiozyma monospora]
MLRENFKKISALLTSSKIKDRTKGLNTLEEINFNSPSVVSKLDRDTTISLIESLSQLISLDKLAYSKSNINSQVESRLVKSSAFLKTIVTNVLCSPPIITKLKHKQCVCVQRYVMNHLFYRKSGLEQRAIFEPTSLNCMKALYALFQVQGFKNKLQEEQYVDALRNVLKCLELLTSKKKLALSNNEALIASSLAVFCEFLRPDCTSTLSLFSAVQTTSSNYYLEILNIILNFSENIFSQNRRETESLILIFKILNACLIDCSNSDIKTCYRMYKVGVKFIIDIKSMNYDAFKEQVVIFINLISDFINVDTYPKIDGDNWNIDERGRLLNDTEVGLLGDVELEDVNDEQSIVQDSSSMNVDTDDSSMVQSDSEPMNSAKVAVYLIYFTRTLQQNP